MTSTSRYAGIEVLFKCARFDTYIYILVSNLNLTFGKSKNKNQEKI